MSVIFYIVHLSSSMIISINSWTKWPKMNLTHSIAKTAKELNLIKILSICQNWSLQHSLKFRMVMFSAFIVSRCMLFFYSVTTDLVVSVKKCCGCSVPLRWCGQSSRDPTVCEPTGKNSGPSPQYFALGNRSHSSGTYRRKSVTTVPK